MKLQGVSLQVIPCMLFFSFLQQDPFTKRISPPQISPTAFDANTRSFSLSILIGLFHHRSRSQLTNPNLLRVYPSSLYITPHKSTQNKQKMPSFTPPSKKDLSAVLETARPFLRGDLESIDPTLPSLFATLRSVGAGECWHKHGTFLAHLTEVYRILKLWSAPDSVALCGLYHSAYSNSYVNLAIFDPSTSRDRVRGLIGESAERLVHLFCVVNRQRLIHDDLLFQYSDQELIEHLKKSEVSLSKGKENNVFDEGEPWRKKLQSLLPADGIKVIMVHK